MNYYATWDDSGSGAYSDFAAYDIQASSSLIDSSLIDSSVIDMGVFWSEARNSQPKVQTVPALKVQESVKCYYNC